MLFLSELYGRMGQILREHGESRKVIASRRRFVINPYGNGKRNKDRY